MPNVAWAEPETVADVCRLLADNPEGAMALSGGTALVLMLQQGLIAPELLVSLRRLDELHGIRRDNDTLRIGAGTTLAEVAASADVRAYAPSLAYACGRVGNPRVRNVATLGGNLSEADYASDPPAVLASLGASCVARKAQARRAVGAAQMVTGFYENALAHDEVLTDIHVPIPGGDRQRRAVYLKYLSRSSEDRACVGVAARADLDGDRVAELDVVVAAVASTPQRVAGPLADAVGRRLDAELIAHVAERYAEAIDPMDDARGSAWYRRQMIAVFIDRALSAVANGEGKAKGGPHG